MYSFIVLILLHLSTTFPKFVNSTEDIAQLITSPDCGLLNDNFMSELNIKSLCPKSPLKLEEVQSKTVYDLTPLLCTQFYEINQKICHLVKTGVNNKNFTSGLQVFVSDVRNKHINVSSFCNSTRLWVARSENFNLKNQSKSVNDYFQKKIGNQASCERICSSINDGSVTDLCVVIIGAEELYENVSLALKAKGMEGGSSLPHKQADVSKPKISETTAKNNGNNHEIKGIVNTEIGNNQKTSTFRNSQISPQKTDTDLPVSLQDLKQKDIGLVTKSHEEDNQNQKEGVVGESIINKDIDLVESKQPADSVLIEPVVKLKNQPTLNSDIGNAVLENEDRENPAEITENKEDNIDNKDMLQTEVQDNEKPDFPDVPENVKGQENDLNIQKPDNLGEPQDISETVERQPLEQDITAFRGGDHLIGNEDSHFFTYFVCMGAVCGVMYILFHNKKKILALAVEGRRGRSHGGGRRRPNTASYSKLDSNLEEAMVSNVSQASVTHVLY